MNDPNSLPARRQRIGDPCPNRRGSNCRCLPKCAVCGWGKHMAIHSSKPLTTDNPLNLHEYQPPESTKATT